MDLTGVNSLDRKEAQIPVTWPLTSPLRSLTPPEVDVVAVEDAVRLEVLTLAGERKGTWNVAPTGSYTLTNAAHVAALGSETDFMVRAYAMRGGLASFTFDQITLSKA